MYLDNLHKRSRSWVKDQGHMSFCFYVHNTEATREQYSVMSKASQSCFILCINKIPL